MKVFVDLETEVKLKFLNHKDPRAWFLTDLEKGTNHEPPKPLFIRKYDAAHLVFNATLY